MGLHLKSGHLSRYRQIVRLLYKYGRGDVLKGAGLEPTGLEEPFVYDNGVTNHPAVHAVPGDFLRRQQAIRDAKAAGSKDTKVLETDDDETRARHLADDLEAMGPTFIKLGQFLSTRADMLPAPYLAALARLQDHVSPIPYPEIEQIVSDELETRISKAFASFETEPLASASLGQVHRAKLRDGSTVAVKVQRPGIRERIQADLEALAYLAGWLDLHTEVGKKHNFESMLEEFRRSLSRELDYGQEARNLVLLGENLSRFPLILVPSPVPDYVTTRVLTMEFVHGRKITDLGPLARLELDGGQLAEELTKAYLYQILVDGFFHADPHPGNIFLTEDGRLAFLDLGMVAQLGTSLQETLLQLVLAISDGRGETAANLILDMGTPVTGTDEQAVRRGIVQLVLQVQGLKMREIALGRLLFEATRVASDGGYRLPRELTLLSKALLNVDEVTRRLDPDFDPNASIRSNAWEIMRHRVLKSFAPGRVFDSLLEVKALIEKMPRRVNQLVDAVAENRLKIKVDAINEALLMEGLQKIANRITVGLMISAMIVGAAMLMRIDTPQFRILGYPGLAMLFFLFAGIAAVWLVLNVALHDMRAAKDKIRSTEKQKSRNPASYER
jgi:predicted unusual protein kinase regulating ubiquinone biosynthesis (AarF/ABC1/UbiB family)